LAKRARAQLDDELLLNDDIYFGLEPENKRTDRAISRRMLRLDNGGFLQGGFYG
jgi:hypothetical protein